MKRCLSTAGLIVAFAMIFLGSTARAQTETTFVTASEEVTSPTTPTTTTVLTPPPIVIIVPPPTTTTTVVPTTTTTTSTTTTTTVVPTTTSTTTIPCISLRVIIGGWRPNTTTTITVNGQTFTAKADPDGLVDMTTTVCKVSDGDSVSGSGISLSGQRRTVVLGVQGGTATEAAPSGGVGSVAFTGSSNTFPLTFTGVGAIVVGILLVLSARQRRHTN